MKQNIFYRTDLDEAVYLYNEGKNYESYEFLGAHKYYVKNKIYMSFSVYAPNAKEVYLTGDFINWHSNFLIMKNINDSGIWNICIDNFRDYDNYKYRIVTNDYREIYKADPYAFYSELRPKTASKIFDINEYQWSDKNYLKNRKNKKHKEEPMSIYELHLGSWMRHPDNRFYTYLELSEVLPDYVKEMGYTHVELMPLNEYSYGDSWGYHVTGYFSMSSRFGTPKGLMKLIDEFHKRKIAVIFDWVPAYFSKDDYGLIRFDGSCVYEKDNEYRSKVEGLGTLYFDFGKNQVKNFLISSALFLLKYFHIDGLRAYSVSAMLYLNYGGKNLVNEYGGIENIEAIEFIKELNSVIHIYYPDAVMIAEESTTFPKVTEKIQYGGLGFDYKCNIGWIQDTLNYFNMDSFYRGENKNLLTFGITYAFNEYFILPFSHNEVVYTKGSMVCKMQGEYITKFSSLKSLYAYQYAQPGKKLMFMGDEIATFEEWNCDKELSWSVLDYEMHRYVKDFVTQLNEIYRREKPLFEIDDSYDGFEWIEYENTKQNVIAFERIDKKNNKVLCFFNFSPVYIKDYRFGVDNKGIYKILINSSHKKFGGETKRNTPLYSKEIPCNGREYSVVLDLPPYTAIFVK